METNKQEQEKYIGQVLIANIRALWVVHEYLVCQPWLKHLSHSFHITFNFSFPDLLSHTKSGVCLEKHYTEVWFYAEINSFPRKTSKLWHLISYPYRFYIKMKGENNCRGYKKFWKTSNYTAMIFFFLFFPLSFCLVGFVSIAVTLASSWCLHSHDSYESERPIIGGMSSNSL